MNAPLSDVLAEYRARLQEIYGDRLERLVLFGSRARGDAEPDSDIDVLVVLSSNGDALSEKDDGCTSVMADLSLKYDTVIMPIFTDAQTYKTSEFSLFQNIRREGTAF
ncbi:MAG: nucleotidyltransferase domain-containing protein [Dongiaceae bacterium]